MEEPVGVQSERVDVGAGAPAAAPVAPAAYPAPAYSGERVSASRTVAVPLAYRARAIVWTIVAVVNIILALRFIFLAAGANDTGFASAMYAIGGALAAPFRGIFGTSTAGTGHPLEWADLLAIVVYSIAAWIVSRVMVIGAAPADRTRATV